MRSAAGVVVLLAGLGCAGLATPSRRVEREALSIDLLSTSPTEDEDRGSSGDYNVQLGATSQALSWDPIDEGTLDEELDVLFAAFENMMPTFAWTEPEHADATVGTEPARGFVATTSGVELHVTVWDCEVAGVRVHLVTSGLPTLAGQLHARSLASATCGVEPVAAIVRPHAWRLVDAEGWTSDGGEVAAEEERVLVTRSDGGIVVDLSSTGPWTDPDVPALCMGTLRLWHGKRSEEITFDEARSRYLDGADGCAHVWEGTDVDGARISGRFEARTCGARGYLAACMVHAPDLGPDACGGLVACAEP